MRLETVAIVGPTGSGKSHLAMELSERVRGGEIVSCDSVQIYRGFQIGCAKPNADEQSRVTHHLIDVADWNEEFDAARFVGLAQRALSDIAGRGCRAILCGGTGLYLRALRFGLLEIPSSVPEVRRRLEEADREQPGWAVERLREIDPGAIATIDLNNPVRVIRALEIFELTGKPASVLREEHGFREERVPMRVVAVRWPDELLRERITKRVHSMVQQGLLDEVSRLLDLGVLPRCRPMGSVGYREACDVVLGSAPREGLEERIVKSTWSYARRQRTWFRKERGVRWYDVTSMEEAVRGIEDVAGFDAA